MNVKSIVSCCIIFIFSLMTLSAQDRASLILDLKKAKVNYQMARVKFDNDKKLFDEEAISQMEFSESKNQLLTCEVGYQKLMLRLISEQSYIIIEKAVKYQTPIGEKRVRITIRSSMEGNENYLDQFEEYVDLFTPEMKSGKTYNIFVSLHHLDEKTIVGIPYEFHVPSLKMGETADVDFELLKDVESLQVLLNYNNRKESRNIFLEKDASTNYIDVTSSQFSQDANLGSNTNYTLSLERFSSSDDIYKLKVVNLPKQVSYAFEDAESRVRLSNLKFNQGVNLRKLSLKIFLPERNDGEVIIDEPIVFYALVLPSDKYKEVFNEPNKRFTSKELEKIQGGKIRLEITPRGIGKLDIKATNLYHEVSVGEQIKFNISLKNEGTRPVESIKIEIDKPYNWSAQINPGDIQSIDPGESEDVQFLISPPENVDAGAQELKIKAIAYANNRRIEADDRSIRIQINAKADILGTILLISLLIFVIIGIVVFGIKISKR